MASRTLVALGLGLVAACLLPAPLRAGDTASIAETVERAFRPLLAEYGVPGIAVAVTAGGRRHFFNYGLAAKDGAVPVTQDTLFEIGSVSKTFTGTLVALAAADGALSLNDHPGRFMPPLRGRPIDAASLRDLGTYTAGGLPLQFPDAVADEAAMTAYFRDWQPSAAPGTQRRYSNPSIGLLGHVAAIAMHGTFADLMEREIFAGLGLENTRLRVPETAMARYAWGHDKAGAPIRVKLGALGEQAYGIRSTSADMIRFVEANIAPETLPARLREAVQGTHVGYVRAGELVQGLGWEQFPYPVSRDRLLAGNAEGMILEANAATPLSPPRMPSEPTLFDKTGSTNGFGAYVAFVPEKRIGIVMLANKSIPIPARIAAAHAVLERLAMEAP